MASRLRPKRNRPKRHGAAKEPSRRRLAFEPLEDRRLLAVAVVDTTLDVVDLNDGLTSLREAIAIANANPGADTIEFAPALTAGGPATIFLEHGELEITNALDDQRPRCGPIDDRCSAAVANLQHHGSHRRLCYP